jgi:hypothetical protein
MPMMTIAAKTIAVAISGTLKRFIVLRNRIARVGTAVLGFQSNNGSDHRAGTIIMQAEKSARKSGFACITLLCGVWSGFNLRSSFRVQEIVPIAGPVRQQHFED